MNTRFTYLGGATYIIEVGSLRFIIDPGFDPEGTEKSEGPGHDLKKTMAPPLPIEQVGEIDAVLLTHQQHFDNLDISGRTLLPKAGRVVTTKESADVLGGNAEGLDSWESVEIADGELSVRVTTMPALHGPSPEIVSATGDTTGFLLEWEGQNRALYITGDSVWFDGLLEIPKRYDIGTCIIHMGAANVPAVGDNRLTMNAEEGVRITQETGAEAVFPAHFEGWAHYKQGRDEVERIFGEAGLGDQLRMLQPGESAEVAV